MNQIFLLVCHPQGAPAGCDQVGGKFYPPRGEYVRLVVAQNTEEARRIVEAEQEGRPRAEGPLAPFAYRITNTISGEDLAELFRQSTGGISVADPLTCAHALRYAATEYAHMLSPQGQADILEFVSKLETEEFFRRTKNGIDIPSTSGVTIETEERGDNPQPGPTTPA